MPSGKRPGSGWSEPSAARAALSTDQQSSMLMYWYPTSFIPVATIASAVFLTKSALMLQLNLFQLFQPIGGVGAMPDASGNGKSSSFSPAGPPLPPPQPN